MALSRRPSKAPSKPPSRPPKSLVQRPPYKPAERRASQSQAMPAVRRAAEAIQSELTPTPAVGTDLRPGQRVRREAMRILREAERNEQNARQRMIWRAIRELFEQLLGPCA